MAQPRNMLWTLRHWVWGTPAREEASTFEQVLGAELGDIDKSRRRRGQPPLAPAHQSGPVGRARASNLMGLAFSGGGIRSATFCLGVLQALAAADLLRRFDYLSTVSGGGYIGGWLVSWIKRSRRGVLQVQRALRRARDGIKAPPLEFIRDYSNYLAPQTGFFSADTWTIASVWLRNTVLNQAIIFLFFAVCLIVPRVLGLALPWVARFPLPEWVPYRGYSPALPGAVAVVLLLWAVRYRLARNLLWFESPDDPHARKDSQGANIRTALLLLCAACFGAAALWYGAANQYTPYVVGASFAIGVYWVGKNSGFEACFRRTMRANQADRWPWALAMTALGSGIVGAGLALAVGRLFQWFAVQGPDATWHLAVWGGPAVLTIMTVVAVVQIGLMGRWLPDDRREWWSRLGAWMFILIAACIGLACVSIYGPLWIAQLFQAFPKLTGGLTLGWVATTIAGVVAGRSARSGGGTAADKSGSDSNAAVEWIAKVAPYIAIAGVLLTISTLLNLVLAAALCGGYRSQPYPSPGATSTVKALDLHARLSLNDTDVRLSLPVDGVVTRRPATAPQVGADVSCVCRYKDGFFPGWRFLEEQHWNLLGPMYRKEDQMPAWGGEAGHWKVSWIGLVLALGAMWFLAWRIDVNEFSMNHFYKNRLVRCYLGATVEPARRREKANPFTGFSPDDDVLMASLHYGAPVTPQENRYVGPYLIVNGALNFTHGERLAWQERKAASFVFSPQYCGYDGELLQTESHGELVANAYRPTSEYAYPVEDGLGGVHLGTAMAASGAAASPNMGYHTSMPVALLLTLFDVRLGRWLGNPRHKRKWKESGPRVGLLYLLNELFGSATNDSGCVYISDGGHFENLGLYELVRRRCHFILACDAEEDHNFTFGGFGNAVRKCRNDLGVDIDLDLRPLLDRDDRGRTSVHAVVGSIDYHDGTPPGILVYLKSSLTKPALHEEPADVLEYSMRAAEFPHQTTADQFFDESQFESYRRLGMHIGDAAIERLRASGLI